MFKFIAGLALLCLTSVCFSQTPAIHSFYEKYKNLENVTDIRLQGWVLKLASTFADEEEAESLLKKITHLRVIVMEEGNLVKADEYNRLIKSVKKDRFEELMKIKEDGSFIDIMIREEGETITDVLVLISGEDSFVLLSLEGALRFKDLRQLEIDVEGGDSFKKIPARRADVPRA